MTKIHQFKKPSNRKPVTRPNQKEIGQTLNEKKKRTLTNLSKQTKTLTHSFICKTNFKFFLSKNFLTFPTLKSAFFLCFRLLFKFLPNITKTHKNICIETNNRKLNTTHLEQRYIYPKPIKPSSFEKVIVSRKSDSRTRCKTRSKFYTGAVQVSFRNLCKVPQEAERVLIEHMRAFCNLNLELVIQL